MSIRAICPECGTEQATRTNFATRVREFSAHEKGGARCSGAGWLVEHEDIVLPHPARPGFTPEAPGTT